jgi:predicted secreted Zn-dependent protease
MRTSSSTLLLAALILSRTAFAQSDAVETVAPGRLEVSVVEGSGQLALYTESDLSQPHDGITRAIRRSDENIPGRAANRPHHPHFQTIAHLRRKEQRK